MYGVVKEQEQLSSHLGLNHLRPTSSHVNDGVEDVDDVVMSNVLQQAIDGYKHTGPTDTGTVYYTNKRHNCYISVTLVRSCRRANYVNMSLISKPFKKRSHSVKKT